MWRRHDLLRLNRGCLGEVRAAARGVNPGVPRDWVDQLIDSGVPAIVRRQETRRPGAVEVGFSSHRAWNGSRLRVSSVVAQAAVEEILTPFAVMELRGRCPNAPMASALDSLCALGAETGMAVGVYGSLALELVTGLPYTTPDSDIDLYVRAEAPEADVAGFYAGMAALQRTGGLRLDAELEWREIYGCKLAELLAGQGTVLCKGLYDVRLVPLAEIARQFGLAKGG